MNKKVIVTLFLLCSLLFGCATANPSSDPASASEPSSQSGILNTVEAENGSYFEIAKTLGMFQAEKERIQINAYIGNCAYFRNFDISGDPYKVDAQIVKYNIDNDKKEQIGTYGPVPYTTLSFAQADNRYLFYTDTVSYYKGVGTLAFTMLDTVTNIITRLKEEEQVGIRTYVMPMDGDRVLWQYAKKQPDETFIYVWEIYTISENKFEQIMTMKGDPSVDRCTSCVYDNDLYLYLKKDTDYYLQKFDFNGTLLSETMIDNSSFIEDENGKTLDTIDYVRVIGDYIYIETMSDRAVLYQFDENGVVKNVFAGQDYAKLLYGNNEREYWTKTNKMIFYEYFSNEIYVFNLADGKYTTYLVQTEANEIPEERKEVDMEKGYITDAVVNHNGDFIFQMNIITQRPSSPSKELYMDFYYYKLFR